MEIKYNNIESPSSLFTFSEVPNLLTIKDDDYAFGTKASFNFLFEGNLQSTVTADSQYYVTFLGETVTSVMSAKNANNKRFFISSDEDSTAASFARALRNCSSLSADFNIIQEGPDVYLIAKTIGQKWTNVADYYQTNISTTYLSGSGTDGTSTSVLWQSKIGLDIFTGEPYDRNNYVTSLEKNFYGDECAFNISPVLATFSKYGEAKPYYFVMNLYKENGEWSGLGTVSGYTTVGYQANNSDKCKYLLGAEMLYNNNKNLTLYTYSNVIPFTVMCGTNSAGYNVSVSVKDSANQNIWSGTTQYSRPYNKFMFDQTVTVQQQYFVNAFYVDVTVSNQTTRFKVIKPLKATEYYQRVYWRNEYGGISFFDFTGSRSSSVSVESETYEKNLFDFYTSDTYESKKIYSIDYGKTTTLSSHLMEESGTYIFESLMKSKSVWTIIDGKTYYIIPKSIDIQEDQTYNDIYTVKLTYANSVN